MRAVALMVVLLLVGYVSCACRTERKLEGCRMNRMLRPLCGTDGCDYINDDALHCAQEEDRQRGLSEEDVVKEAYPGQCRDDGLAEDNKIRVLVDNNL